MLKDLFVILYWVSLPVCFIALVLYFVSYLDVRKQLKGDKNDESKK